MRVKLVLEYDGTDFCGWQIQPEKRTVQEELERAIERLTGKRSGVVGSGRTDSGVHAKMQVAHFDTDFTSIPADRYASALDSVLPPDVKVLKSEAAEENFHARFSAKRKTYEYKIYYSAVERPLKERYAARVVVPLDAEKMNRACGYLIGEHDFRCFLASNSSVKDTVREIYSARVTTDGEDLTFTVCGNGFLYNMVRIIAGTLVKIGSGDIPPQAMAEIISKEDRSLAGKTMPAKGLTLKSVEYV